MSNFFANKLLPHSLFSSNLGLLTAEYKTLASAGEGLLKANIAVLQDDNDDHGTIDFASKAAAILVDILRDPKLDLSAKFGPPPFYPLIHLVDGSSFLRTRTPNTRPLGLSPK
ncbi:hypothetical protein EV702DRAFT_1043744 [Suillus placidus]|uniref:Uncharacterized protein n=1 Tax=Suillus placidus TaxID=48579 RepID=A0A9P6ZZJ5_9AGAM|nr:hypothetical protein EV702DRAFT_1043744 [Suillus placidus]